VFTSPFLPRPVWGWSIIFRVMIAW
jgi:hypothetical protein